MNIRLVSTNKDIADCYFVMSELRPHVLEGDFVSRVRSQEKSGYRLAMGEHGGKIVAVAGFRTGENLAWGRFLYVDDLIISGEHRSKGYGAEFLFWLRDYAAKEGCSQLHLDCGIQREDAQRFYERERMLKVGFHFVEQLSPNKALQPTSGRDAAFLG